MFITYVLHITIIKTTIKTSMTTIYKQFKKAYVEEMKNKGFLSAHLFVRYVWCETKRNSPERQKLIDKYIKKIVDQQLEFIKGDKCFYVDRSKKILSATITMIDKTIIPYSYEIRLDRDGSYINTEKERLCYKE